MQKASKNTPSEIEWVGDHWVDDNLAFNCYGQTIEVIASAHEGYGQASIPITQCVELTAWLVDRMRDTLSQYTGGMAEDERLSQIAALISQVDLSMCIEENFLEATKDTK